MIVIEPTRSPREIRVDREHAGQRLDNFVAARLRNVPRSRIYRSVRSGEVRVNKGRARQGYRLREGDWVRLPPLADSARRAPAAAPSAGLAARLAGAVLHEDDALLVVDKPSGLAVHGGSGRALGLIEAMRALRGPRAYLELVHRLDRDTSGCLVLAKRRVALVALHAAMRDGRIDKRYRLLVKGRWRGGGRRIDQPLRRAVGRSGERVVRADPRGRPASTAFTPLAVSARASLLEARLLTGRTHQIRVHAAEAGAPLAGDRRYGDREFNHDLRELGLKRLFLHASRLRLEHPTTGASLDLRAPLPAELHAVASALGLEVGR